jgi:hypothetical protein
VEFVRTAGAFDEACRAVTRYLSEAIPLGFWAVTRFDGARQVYLTVDGGADYGIEPGNHLPWSETYCRHAVSGEAPPGRGWFTAAGRLINADLLP